MISQSKQPKVLQHFPFIIGIVFGLWGLYLVIHYIGHSGLGDLVSMLVGLGLIAVGVISFLMLWKRRHNES
jgi:bacteriorhodopsin